MPGGKVGLYIRSDPSLAKEDLCLITRYSIKTAQIAQDRAWHAGKNALPVNGNKSPEPLKAHLKKIQHHSTIDLPLEFR
jgi:hypothetical protein